MQTFSQSFAGAQTWTLNVPGKYFTTLECSNAVNVRFYLGGKQLDLGQISGLLAGLEVTLGELNDTAFAFDRVEIDVGGVDTVTVGIGNGQARYNRSQGTVAISGQAVSMSNTQQTVGVASANMLAANATRRYLFIQNNDAGTDIWVRLDGGAAAVGGSGSIKIAAGNYWEAPAGAVPNGAITAIASAANANVITVEA